LVRERFPLATEQLSVRFVASSSVIHGRELT
jgi:hypothetical protein